MTSIHVYLQLLINENPKTKIRQAKTNIIRLIICKNLVNNNTTTRQILHVKITKKRLQVYNNLKQNKPNKKKKYVKKNINI